MGVKLLTEKNFQQTVVEYAKFCGWWTMHIHDSRKTEPGLPDLVMIRKGIIIFAELKLEDKKLTEVQEKVVGLLGEVSAKSDNVFVEVWRPSDWETIKETLR